MYPNGPVCSVKHPTFSGTIVGLPRRGAFDVMMGGGRGGGGCVRDMALGNRPLGAPFFRRRSVTGKKAVRVGVATRPAG